MTTTGSADFNFIGVGSSATMRSLVVNTTLAVNSSVQTSQSVTMDELTTQVLQVGTTTASATVLVVTGDTLSIMPQSSLECNTPVAGSTAVRDALVLQQGVTASAVFPEGVLTFTSGVLTNFRPPFPPQTASFEIVTTNISTGSSDAQSFALPLVATGTYDFTVAWGDGSSSTITAYNQPDVVHTYATGGTYTLTFAGTLTGWVFNDAGDKLKLSNINAWGDVVLGDAGETGFFSGCSNMTISPGAGSPLRPGTASLASCFQDCTSLNSTNVATWDVSAVQDVSFMFAGASTFNVNLSSWNTSAAQKMSGVFSDCTAFNNGDAGNTGTAQLTWQTSSAADVSSMFLNCTAFNQTLVFSDLAASVAADHMFSGCSLFNNGDTSNMGAKPMTFSFGSITSLNGMFLNCTAFNQTVALTVGAGLLDCSYLFAGCAIFNNGNTSNSGTQPISISTPSLQLASGMFLSCAAFNQTVTFSSASRLIQVDQMFQDASVFNNGDTSDAGGHPIAWTTTSTLASLVAMFHNATAFNQTVTLSSVGRTSSMFYGASRFNNGNTTNAATKPLTLIFNSNFTQGNYMFSACTSFNQRVMFGGDMSAVQDLSSAFTGASLFNNGDLTDAGSKPLVFGATSSLTDTTQMFSACSSFNQTVTFGDLSNLQFGASMFEDTSVFNNGDTSDAGGHPIAWTTPALLTASSMFGSAPSFNQTVTLSSLGTNAEGMFNFATRFNNGDTSNAGTRPFRISSTALDTSVSGMFYGCTSFNQTINLISFNGFSRTDEMFYGATLFNNGDVTNAGERPLDFGVMSAPIVNANGMFSDCTAFNQTVTFTDLSNLDTATTMFENAALFNNGDLTDAGLKPITWPTTSAFTSTSSMFQSCAVFNQTVVFADTTSLVSTESMFYGCVAFNNGDTTNASSKPLVWTTTTLIHAASMFANCASFNQALTFSDMSHVTGMNSMLHNCNLFKQDLSAWTVTACTNFTNFYTADMNAPNSVISQTNYDALLLLWATQALRSGVTFDMGTTKYSAAAVAAHSTLTGTYGWTVNDGGAVP